MNTEIKQQEKTGYSFDSMVKGTEKLIVHGYKKIKTLPPPTAFIADDIGLGACAIPTMEGMKIGEVIKTIGKAMAGAGKNVRGMGVVCEAYVSDRTDIAPSKDPKAKEVLLMAFADSTGKREVRTFKASKGKITKIKGIDGSKFHGLVDDFWAGYKTPLVSADAKPNLA